MAKLSAHGQELDRREYASFRLAVMSDGNIMKNDGSGWKLYRRCKPGTDVVEYARDCRKRYNERPYQFHEYIGALQQCVSLEHRWMLHQTITLMPEDPDGVWAMMDDRNLGCDFDGINDACKAYRAFVAEFESREVKA